MPAIFSTPNELGMAGLGVVNYSELMMSFELFLCFKFLMQVSS